MAILSYRWWVPNLPVQSRRPAVLRFLRDPAYVRGWMYLVMPALMAAAALTSAEARHGLGLVAAVGVSIAWVGAIRARFAVAEGLAARRRTPPATEEPLRRAA